VGCSPGPAAPEPSPTAPVGAGALGSAFPCSGAPGVLFCSGAIAGALPAAGSGRVSGDGGRRLSPDPGLHALQAKLMKAMAPGKERWRLMRGAGAGGEFEVHAGAEGVQEAKARTPRPRESVNGVLVL
jgi:hypothetical protein